MSYETLNKEQIEGILRDKKVVLETLKDQSTTKGFNLSNAMKLALMNGGCRSCVWDRVEVMEKFPDSDDPRKVLKPIGHPFAESKARANGNEPQPACRFCKHVRYALRDAGESDLYF